MPSSARIDASAASLVRLGIARVGAVGISESADPPDGGSITRGLDRAGAWIGGFEVVLPWSGRDCACACSGPWVGREDKLVD